MAKVSDDFNPAQEVQVFDVSEALQRRNLVGRVDMATSPDSFIAVFQVPPRGGETHVHQHPDSDQILFILKGEATVEGLSGRYSVKENQGVLIPAGVYYGFTNTTTEDLIFLSMRTEASGGRRVAYVEETPAQVTITIPEAEIGAKGIGTWIFAYALNRRTIGLSPLLFEDWNKGSLLRMNSDFERTDGQVVVRLPERFAQWYDLSALGEADYRIISEPDKTRVRVDLSPLIRRESLS